MLSRDEIEDRWIGCCSDPEYFRAELEALGTAKRLADWLESISDCGSVTNDGRCDGCEFEYWGGEECKEKQARTWLGLPR